MSNAKKRGMSTKHLHSILTTGQCARIIQCAPRTVAKWFDSGKLRGHRLPGSNDRRVGRDELLKFIRAHQLVDAERRLLESAAVNVLTVGLDDMMVAAIRAAFDGQKWFSIRAVDTMYEAGCAAQEQVPDIVLFDLCFGKAEVVSAAKIAKKSGAKVMLLANEDDPDPLWVIESPKLFDGHLSKPCDPKVLMGVVKRVADTFLPLTVGSSRQPKDATA